jgi:hypothetical protein
MSQARLAASCLAAGIGQRKADALAFARRLPVDAPITVR